MEYIDFNEKENLTLYTQNSVKKDLNLSQIQGVKKSLNYKKPLGLCLSCEFKNKCGVYTDTRAEVLFCSYKKNFNKSGLI